MDEANFEDQVIEQHFLAEKGKKKGIAKLKLATRNSTRTKKKKKKHKKTKKNNKEKRYLTQYRVSLNDKREEENNK